MDDVEMNYNNNNNKENKNENQININNKIEDSYSILDNIENEINSINKTFLESLDTINAFAPFITNGKEINMEKSEKNEFRQIENYDQERNNFENTIDSYSNKMNDYFKNIFDLTNKLKQYEEFNFTEEDLKKKLLKLKKDNNTSNKNMDDKLKQVEKILSELNVDISMSKDRKMKEQLEEDLEEDIL